MANVVIYDELTKRPVSYLKSVNTPDYSDRTDVLINPDVSGIDLKYSLVEDSSLRNMTKDEKDRVIAADKLDRYREHRKTEYDRQIPIGDQLDAILKHLNYMQLNGETDLVDELDGIIGKWLQVKKDYPKPE